MPINAPLLIVHFLVEDCVFLTSQNAHQVVLLVSIHALMDHAAQIYWGVLQSPNVLCQSQRDVMDNAFLLVLNVCSPIKNVKRQMKFFAHWMDTAGQRMIVRTSHSMDAHELSVLMAGVSIQKSNAQRVVVKMKFVVLMVHVLSYVTISHPEERGLWNWKFLFLLIC